MSNYKQTSVTGESWIRANRVVVENPFGGAPSIGFAEERVFNIGGESVTQPSGNVGTYFTPFNANNEFNILNPETGEVVGVAKYSDVYVMLHSLYIHLATIRDASETPVE